MDEDYFNTYEVEQWINIKGLFLWFLHMIL